MSKVGRITSLSIDPWRQIVWLPTSFPGETFRRCLCVARAEYECLGGGSDVSIHKPGPREGLLLHRARTR